ncbi:class I SAM-dependent methyltransferase [Clostridiaceae bacterium 35-E11]
MELSPRLYHLFVRPPLLSKFYFNRRLTTLLSPFSFQNKFVLDFGCGIGSSSFMFQPNYYMGIDCDERRIAYAKYLYSNYNFITSKDSELCIENNSIDYVLIMAVLHHIPSISVTKYLQEFQRILKPNGQVIVIEPCFYEGSYLRNWYMSCFDKGNYIRSEMDYLNLFHQQKYTTHLIKKFNKCFVYNEIFFIANPKT